MEKKSVIVSPEYLRILADLMDDCGMPTMRAVTLADLLDGLKFRTSPDNMLFKELLEEELLMLSGEEPDTKGQEIGQEQGSD